MTKIQFLWKSTKELPCSTALKIYK